MPTDLTLLFALLYQQISVGSLALSKVWGMNCEMPQQTAEGAWLR